MSLKTLFQNKFARNIVFTLIGIGLIILVWFIISLTTYQSLFPHPGDVFKRFGQMFILGSTYEAIGGTLLRLIISLSISFLLALILGVLGGLNDVIYKILNPSVIVLRTLPVAAIIFIMIVLLKPAYALFIITSLTMFPLIYESIARGIKNIDNNVMDALRLETSKYSPRAVFQVVIPSAKENIILGIVQSLGLGMKVSLMAETLVGTDVIKGLGRLLYRGYLDLDMTLVFASAMYAIILIGIVDVILHFLKKHFE